MSKKNRIELTQIQTEKLNDVVVEQMNEYFPDNQFITQVKTVPRKYASPHGDYILVFCGFLEKASSHIKDHNALRVFCYLLSIVGYGNILLGIDQKSIAEKTGISLSSCKKAISCLIEMNILIVHKSVSDKRRNDYTINNAAAWKGGMRELKIAIDRGKVNAIQLPMFTDTQM